MSDRPTRTALEQWLASLAPIDTLPADVAAAFDMSTGRITASVPLRHFTRQFVKLAPGETKPMALLDDSPEGFRMETDDELRARFKGISADLILDRVYK